MTTLAIKDLSVSKELDSKAMADVSGGTTWMPGYLASMVNAYSDFAEIHSTALAYTGPQGNVQNAMVNNTQVGGHGAANANVSPIGQMAHNSASAYSASSPYIYQ